MTPDMRQTPPAKVIDFPAQPNIDLINLLTQPSINFIYFLLQATIPIISSLAEEDSLSVSRWLESNLSKPWVQDAMKNVLTNRGTAITTANRDKGDNRPV